MDFAAGFPLDSAEEDVALLDEAIRTATGADHVVVFLGLPVQAESEGFDRTTMDLPANQLSLLQRVSAVHDSVVVVLVGGSTVQMSTWDHRAAAILNCWLSGQASGGAVADLLTGVANPSGKLAETIPVRLEDNSSYLNFPGDPGVVRYGEGVFVGYRGYDKSVVDVSYPFGYGLSYTSFTIGGVTATVSGSVAGGDLSVAVSATVTNIGEVAGAEVVQVYVGDLESEVARPVRELKGFAKVALEPGASTTVTIDLDERAFAYWSQRLGRWAVEAGEFEIAVGSSSRDIADQVRAVDRRPVGRRSRWVSTRPCTSGWPTSAVGSCCRARPGPARSCRTRSWSRSSAPSRCRRWPRSGRWGGRGTSSTS